MDQFLATLPKSILALVILVVGLLVIRQIQPPHTLCDTQMEYFRDQQKKFLYRPAPVGGIQKASLVKEFTDNCKEGNNPGACFELFEGIRKMTVDLEAIPENCSEAVADEKEINSNLWDVMKLMVQMAWGEKMPASYMQKGGWFDASEISLFCTLRRHSIRFFGKPAFDQWQEKMLTSMPQAAGAPREQVWSRTILSTQCEMYR